MEKEVFPVVPQVAVVQRMVAERQEREDAVATRGFLPIIRHDNLISLRKRELLHKVFVVHYDW